MNAVFFVYEYKKMIYFSFLAVLPEKLSFCPKIARLILIGAREAGGPPHEWGKAVIFQANVIFFGQKLAAKNEKNV